MNDREVYPCSTCKHCERNWFKKTFIGSVYMECHRPGQRIDLVSGKMEHAFLILERRDPDACGARGKYHSDRDIEGNEKIGHEHSA